MERSGMRELPGFPPATRAFIRGTIVRNDVLLAEERIMPGELVLCSVADGVALVTLNNPPLNLVTLELTHAPKAPPPPPARPEARPRVRRGAGHAQQSAAQPRHLGADARAQRPRHPAGARRIGPGDGAHRLRHESVLRRL